MRTLLTPLCTHERRGRPRGACTPPPKGKLEKLELGRVVAGHWLPSCCTPGPCTALDSQTEADYSPQLCHLRRDSGPRLSGYKLGKRTDFKWQSSSPTVSWSPGMGPSEDGQVDGWEIFAECVLSARLLWCCLELKISEVAIQWQHLSQDALWVSSQGWWLSRNPAPS